MAAGKTRWWWLVAALVALVVVAALIVVRGGPRLGRPTATAASGSGRPTTARDARLRARAGAWQSVVLSGAEVVDAGVEVVGELAGRVISAGNGKPVPGAELHLVGPGGAHAVRTDAAGQFAFAPPEEGSYAIVLVSAEGFLPLAAELGSSPIELVARRGRALRGAVIALTPAVEYLVSVVDPQGAPVGGATVELFDADDHELGLGSLPTRQVSDARGEVRLRAPDGTILEARHDGFSPGRARIDFAAQVGKRVKIALGPAGSAAERVSQIRGRVVDGVGTPLPEVTVVAHFEPDNPANPRARLEPGARTETSAAGEFLLSGLLRSSFTVSASDGRSAPATVRGVAAEPGGGSPITLVLVSGSTLRGTVTAADGAAPVAAFSVVLSQPRGLATETVRVATVFDAAGRYLIEHLAPGSYRVMVAAEGFAPAPEQQIDLTRDASADFVLSRGATLTGVVRDRATREPLDGAKVSLEGRHAGPGAVPLLAMAMTDASGMFELTGLGAGEHSILAAAEGHHGRILGGILVRGSERLGPLEIELGATAKGEEPRIELVGIGAVLAPKGEVLVIGKVLEGGGAAEVGLAEGDAVLAVDGVDVAALGFDGCIQRIRGPEGTSVVLLIRRGDGGAPAPITVPRRRVAA